MRVWDAFAPVRDHGVLSMAVEIHCALNPDEDPIVLVDIARRVCKAALLLEQCAADVPKNHVGVHASSAGICTV